MYFSSIVQKGCYDGETGDSVRGHKLEFQRKKESELISELYEIGNKSIRVESN